jgi:xylose isomerase
VKPYFSDIAPIRYAGTSTTEELAFRWYDRDRIVLGKRMEEQLRIAVCYWHSFGWNGFDPFGYGGTFQRPWEKRTRKPRSATRPTPDAAFEFFVKLGAPYYCFHDRDVAPEGDTPRESVKYLHAMVDVLAERQAQTGIRLLWGTANLFSHRRYMAGAATNPDPEIFAMAALQVKEALDATRRLGGENYVLWGGREGYETLLNTRVGQELDQLGRFLNLVVEYKYRIGFKGAILIEPKPREPAKHQYDFDVATVHGFLQRYGLTGEVKVNIEANHATLAGHSFEHEVATAIDLGIFGSLDMNRGDAQCGWDTDQFPNSMAETALVLYLILKGGGLGDGGLNFDAKVRRQSIAPEDMFHGHVGAMDVCARALLVAEAMVQDDQLERQREQRYAGWNEPLGEAIMGGHADLAELAARVLQRNVDVEPVSGRQEQLENLLNRYV